MDAADGERRDQAGADARAAREADRDREDGDEGGSPLEPDEVFGGVDADVGATEGRAHLIEDLGVVRRGNEHRRPPLRELLGEDWSAERTELSRGSLFAQDVGDRRELIALPRRIAARSRHEAADAVDEDVRAVEVIAKGASEIAYVLGGDREEDRACVLGELPEIFGATDGARKILVRATGVEEHLGSGGGRGDGERLAPRSTTDDGQSLHRVPCHATPCAAKRFW